MALFRKRPKTSQQKAQKAQVGILARLIACGYLVYIVVQMLQTSPEDDTISPALKIVIVIVFLAAAAVVITLTLVEFIRNLMSGMYKAASYVDDFASTDGESAEEQPDEELTPPEFDEDSDEQ
ncbi:MAG: hypothetical protein LBH28_07520 [Oscillospiraceae bacterium]|jgi:type III secretory pathway component EscS|nr:hypothetical protein [Oscillospiraceae bacterium]